MGWKMMVAPAFAGAGRSLRAVVAGACLLAPSLAPAQDRGDGAWDEGGFDYDWVLDPDGDGRDDGELKDWEPSREEVEYDQLIARLSQTRIDEWPMLDLKDDVLPQLDKGSTGVFAPIGGDASLSLRGEVFTVKVGNTWTEDWIVQNADDLWKGERMRLESVELGHGTTVAEGLLYYLSLDDPSYQHFTFTFQYAQFPPADPTVISSMPTARPSYVTEGFAYRIFTKNLWTGVEVESGALYREQRYLGYSLHLGWNDVWVLWGDSFHRQAEGYETRIEPTTAPPSMRSFLEGQVGHPGNVVTTWARARPL